MPTPVSFVQLTIALPKRDYATYHGGVALLTRVMGRQAPNVLTLIVHTLRCRDRRGLAEDYLDSIIWPAKANGAPGALKGARNGGRKLPSHGSRN